MKNSSITFYKLVSTFFGILTSAAFIGGLHIIQGLVLDDWSGLHPFYRIYYIINHVLLGAVVGVVILVLIHLFRIKMIKNVSDFFKYGLILGSMGIGNLFHPCLSFEYFDLVVFLMIVLASFFKAKRRSE